MKKAILLIGLLAVIIALSGCLDIGDNIVVEKEVASDLQGLMDFTYSCNWENNSIKCEGTITNTSDSKVVSDSIMFMSPTNSARGCSLDCQGSSLTKSLPQMESGDETTFTLYCNLNQRVNTTVKLYLGGGLYISPRAC